MNHYSFFYQCQEALAMRDRAEVRSADFVATMPDTFEQLAVTFEPVANHDMLWEIFTLPT
jgi:hypothetical protein